MTDSSRWRPSKWARKSIREWFKDLKQHPELEERHPVFHKSMVRGAEMMIRAGNNAPIGYRDYLLEQKKRTSK